MYQLPTAPQSIAGILDDGFRLFRASWRPLLPLAFVASLISAVPQFMFAGLAEIKPGQPLPGLAVGAGTVTTFLVVIALSMVAYSIMLAGVDRAARGGATSIREAFAVGVRRSPAVFLTGILVGLAVVAGLVLLVIPGLYLMVALYPVLLLPIAEQLGARQCIRRAMQLVKGSWWRTAGVLSVVGLLVIALGGIVSLAAGLAMAPFINTQNPQNASSGLMALQFVVSIVVAPVLPLTYCIMYAVYTDLRLRKDGGDLLERAAAAGS